MCTCVYIDRGAGQRDDLHKPQSKIIFNVQILAFKVLSWLLNLLCDINIYVTVFQIQTSIYFLRMSRFLQPKCKGLIEGGKEAFFSGDTIQAHTGAEEKGAWKKGERL